MTRKLAAFILASLAATTDVQAASLGGGSLSAYVGHAGAMVFAAKWRHSSAAALLTCRKIHDREERERCLGHMEHPYGVPPKPKPRR
jgi:hypothetical protein